MAIFNKSLTALVILLFYAVVLGSTIPVRNAGIVGRETVAVETRSTPDLVAGNITATELTICTGKATAEQLRKTFATIVSIPDSVLEQGDNATTQWLRTNGYRASSINDRDADDWWQDTKCALAIAAFIGSNLVTAAKIIRMKDYIEALGGVAEAAELLLKASTWAERMEEGGAALVSLAAEILGIAIIKDACT